jgi:hypothetical protein
VRTSAIARSQAGDGSRPNLNSQELERPIGHCIRLGSLPHAARRHASSCLSQHANWFHLALVWATKPPCGSKAGFKQLKMATLCRFRKALSCRSESHLGRPPAAPLISNNDRFEEMKVRQSGDHAAAVSSNTTAFSGRVSAPVIASVGPPLARCTQLERPTLRHAAVL